MSLLRIGVLFPATFNLNADAANATVLVKRLTLSGFDAEEITVDDDAIASGIDVDALIIGSPSSSVLSAPEYRSTIVADFVRRVMNEKVPVLAVSNGFHLLGTMTDKSGDPLGGLGLIPAHTTFGTAQFVTIGAVAETPWGTVVGIENHNATVVLDSDAVAWGAMDHGYGNNTGVFEGFATDSLWATHLNGPVFALNPELADAFAHLVVARRGGKYVRSDALDGIDRLAKDAAAHLVRKQSA